MQKLIITTSNRLLLIPNSYFRDISKFFPGYLEPEGIRTTVVNIDKTNLEDQIISLRPDFIFFTRGYGFSKKISDICNKYNVIKIMQIDDLHNKSDKQLAARHNSFSNVDFIMVSYYENFLKRKEYSKYFNKVCNFPFYAPNSCFKKNIDKLDKVLLSGRCSKVYSFRNEIKKFSKEVDFIEILNHPGYYDLKHEIIGEKYYNKINEYKYSITASADNPLDYPVLKFFELPATGSICFFEEISSLKDFGFIKDKHFISVNQNNFKKILSNYKSFYCENMINNCINLIDKKHRGKNRALQLSKIIKNYKVIHWNEAI